MRLMHATQCQQLLPILLKIDTEYRLYLNEAASINYSEFNYTGNMAVGVRRAIEYLRQAPHIPTAIPLRIHVRPLLVEGCIAYTPAVVEILLDSEQTPTEAAHTLWHELVHLLLILGGRTDHDEEQVDKIAARLAQACPEVLTLCGLTNKFTGKQTETNSL